MERLRRAPGADAHMLDDAARDQTTRAKTNERARAVSTPSSSRAARTSKLATINEDCPAKRDSARCVRAAAGILQRRWRHVRAVVAGDFNMQKVQLHRRLLTGEGAG